MRPLLEAAAVLCLWASWIFAGVLAVVALLTLVAVTVDGFEAVWIN